MRTELKKLNGIRSSFTGKISDFGTKRAFRGDDLPTILLTDVQDQQGKVVCDHLWFTQGKQMKGLKIGQRITFDARVTPYEKGYQGRREDVYRPVSVDYRLSRPTKVKVVSGSGQQSRPDLERP